MLWLPQEDVRLPRAYTEVEYLESSGTQWIQDTLTINPYTQNVKFKMKTYAENNEQEMIVFGGIETNHLEIGYGTAPTRLFYYSNRVSAGTPTSIQSVRDKVIEWEVETSPKKLIYNGITYTSTVASLDVSTTVYILSSGGTYPFIGKFYYGKIYIDNVLVRDYVPCYRNSDNKPGLYDLITKTFYTNNRTGEFGYGYSENAEYIESSGTQYIDLGTKGNQDSRVIIDYEVVGGYNSGQRLFGSRTNPSSNGFFISSNNNVNSLYFNYGSRYLDYTRYNPSIRHTVDFNKNKIILDNELIYTFDQQTFTTPNNLLLFAGDQAGTSTKWAFKIYSCKLYNNGVIIRDLKPKVLVNVSPSGVKAFEGVMYDTIENKYYQNSGTGVFGFSMTKNLQYIENTKYGYFKSDINVDYNDRVETKVRINNPNNTNHLFGYYSVVNRPSFCAYIRTGNTRTWWYTLGAGAQETPIGNIQSDIDYEISFTKDEYKVNNKIATNLVTTSFTGLDLPFYIFWAGDDFMLEQNLKGRMYYLKRYRNGELIESLIPKIDYVQDATGNMSTNIYMFDSVNNKKYNNLGSSDLIAGPEIDYVKYKVQPLAKQYIINNKQAKQISTMYLGVSNTEIKRM